MGDHLTHARGQAEGIEIGRQKPPTVVVLDEGTGVGKVPDDFNQEEWIAVGLAAKRMGESHALVRHLVSGRRLQQVDDLDVFEAQEIEAIDAGLPAQVGQGSGQRMRSRQVTFSEGPHHEHRHGDGGGHQVAQQLQAGGVHPVQVIEHHDKRCSCGSQGEEAAHAFEDQESLGVGVAAGRGRWHREPTSQIGQEVSERQSLGIDQLSQQLFVGVVDQL